MNRVDVSTPVLIFPLENYLGLGIARSLGRLGVPIYGCGSAGLNSSHYSRYLRTCFDFGFGKASRSEAVDALLRIGRTIGRRTILIPTFTETLLFVADNAEVLQQSFLFPLNDASLMHWIAGKEGLYYLAKQHGIPTPESSFPKSADELKGLADALSFPVMLKGIDGRRLQLRTGRTMEIANDPEHLLASYARMEEPSRPNLMIQELIPQQGEADWMFDGYFNAKSDCMLSFTGRKLRQAPPHVGYTSLGMCCRNETIETMSKALLNAIGYRGMVDIDFRFDTRDGTFKIIDINPRIGATFRLFVNDADIDTVRAFYLDLTGQPVPSGVMHEGRKWFVEDRDLGSGLRQIRNKSMTIVEWLRSYRGVREAAWFAADDPLPFCAMSFNRLRASMSNHPTAEPSRAFHPKGATR